MKEKTGKKKSQRIAATRVPENPTLPDTEVKIRCLACNKKLKAPGVRFMRSVCCPNCKAKPFRFELIEDDLKLS
jgi:Zn finger protein HypA/HybF involved in hydrogenase expression